MGAILGLFSALGIGGSELFGRRLMDRSSALTTGVVIQLFAGLTAVLSMVFVASELIWSDLLLGAVSGLGMGVGIIGYLVGLQRASSAVIGPFAGTISALIPYVYTVVTGDRPSAIAIGGAALAIAGLVLITAGGDVAGVVRAGVLWGVLAGVSYGLALTVVIDTSEASGAWPAVGQRVVGCSLVAILAVRRDLPTLPPSGTRLVAIASGVLGGAASVLYLVGVRIDAAPAVVTSAMFPAVTVAVGYAFFSDSVTRAQVVGLAMALLGIIGVVTG